MSISQGINTLRNLNDFPKSNLNSTLWPLWLLYDLGHETIRNEGSLTLLSVLRKGRSESLDLVPPQPEGPEAVADVRKTETCHRAGSALTAAVFIAKKMRKSWLTLCKHRLLIAPLS